MKCCGFEQDLNYSEEDFDVNCMEIQEAFTFNFLG